MTDLELFQCFNVDLAVSKDVHLSGRHFKEVWLWKIHKRRKVRCNRKTRLENAIDTIKPDITIHPRGSLGRLQDLQKFYAEHPTETPFAQYEE